MLKDPRADWLHAAVQVLHVLCGVAEYDELPVRHNEDKINTTLAGEVRWPTDSRSADDPHTKANLLLQVFHLPHQPPSFSPHPQPTPSHPWAPSALYLITRLRMP